MPGSAKAEIELKFEIEPGDAERLRDALLDGGDTARRLHSVYFDTPGRSVRRAGYALRVRHDGAARLQTIKSRAAGAGLFGRCEWERTIAGDRPELVADEPLAGFAGDKGLAPLFESDVERVSALRPVGDGAVEIALDHGEIRAGTRRQPFAEVEFELVRGVPALLFDAARQWCGGMALRVAVQSKADRGYALARRHAPGAVKASRLDIAPGGDARSALTAIVSAGIAHFRRNEDRLRVAGRAELIHQARVALRRLRSALSLFDAALAPDETAQRLDAELRWLALRLGEVRDLDVATRHIDADAIARVRRVRARLWPQVRADLASPRARAAMFDLVEWLHCGDGPRRLAGLDAADVADAALDRAHRRVRRSLKHLDGTDAALHRLRIAAKKLRYGTDFFAGLYPSPKRRRRHAALRAALVELQDELGQWHDLVAAPALLASIGLPPRDGDASEAARLAGRCAASAERLIALKRFWR